LPFKCNLQRYTEERGVDTEGATTEAVAAVARQMAGLSLPGGVRAVATWNVLAVVN
jgi:hypothetical protein